MRTMTIKIIGTNHYMMSKEALEGIIKDENPEIIGTEFCQTRLNYFILNPPKQEGQEDKTIIGKISQAIKNKAKKQNVVYGSDMITASKYALDNKIPLVLLDRDVNEIKSLMEKIPREEMARFKKEIIAFENESLKIDNDIDEKIFLENLKKDFPIAFELLITSRELFITNQILKTMVKNPNKRILIFIGKGHLEKIKLEIGLQ